MRGLAIISSVMFCVCTSNSEGFSDAPIDRAFNDELARADDMCATGSTTYTQVDKCLDSVETPVFQKYLPDGIWALQHFSNQRMFLASQFDAGKISQDTFRSEIAADREELQGNIDAINRQRTVRKAHEAAESETESEQSKAEMEGGQSEPASEVLRQALLGVAAVARARANADAAAVQSLQQSQLRTQYHNLQTTCHPNPMNPAETQCTTTGY